MLSLLGIIPGTIIYVFIGTGISDITEAIKQGGSIKNGNGIH